RSKTSRASRSSLCSASLKRKVSVTGAAAATAAAPARPTATSRATTRLRVLMLASLAGAESRSVGDAGGARDGSALDPLLAHATRSPIPPGVLDEGPVGPKGGGGP